MTIDYIFDDIYIYILYILRYHMYMLRKNDQGNRQCFPRSVDCGGPAANVGFFGQLSN